MKQNLDSLFENIDFNTFDLLSCILGILRAENYEEILKGGNTSLLCQKLSQFLLSVKILGSGQVGVKVIRSVLVDKMLEGIKDISTIRKEHDINKLAAEAGEFLDMTRNLLQISAFKILPWLIHQSKLKL